MARTTRDIADYYPHAAKFGKTIRILEARWGNDGYAAWFKLLQVLTAAEGHAYDCSNLLQWEDLLGILRVKETVACEMLGLLAQLGKIDRELWEKGQVIWCENLVKGLDALYKRRGRAIPKRPSLSGKLSTGYPQENTSVIPDSEIGAEGTFPKQECSSASISGVRNHQSRVEDSREEQQHSILASKDAAAAAISESGMTPEGVFPKQESEALSAVSARLKAADLGLFEPTIAEIEATVQRRVGDQALGFVDFVLAKLDTTNGVKNRGAWALAALTRNQSFVEEWRRQGQGPPARASPKPRYQCPKCQRSANFGTATFTVCECGAGLERVGEVVTAIDRETPAAEDPVPAAVEEDEF